MELLKALAGRKVWILNPEVTRSELKLGVDRGLGLPLRGYGIRVSFNDRAAATLLLDTGASGVTSPANLPKRLARASSQSRRWKGWAKAERPTVTRLGWTKS
jgi:hypothetical protein